MALSPVVSPTKRKYNVEETFPSKRVKAKEKTWEDQFHVIKASLVLPVPPFFEANPIAGIQEMLDSMVMRYIPSLRGIVLSHSNLMYTSRTAIIKGDCPYLVCSVQFDSTIWSPRIGMLMRGKINLCSPDHISLLVHRTFNVSIPRCHIPEIWEFEYGPAGNDPEFGHNREHDKANTDITQEQGDGGGRWVQRITGERLGGEGGYLEFTVIGLTVANEMLSLLGSIQPNPFAAEHNNYPLLPRRRPSGEEGEVEMLTVQEDAEVDVESDEDTFIHLHKRADDAAGEVAKRTTGGSGKEKGNMPRYSFK